jgi:hypothetical protein
VLGGHAHVLGGADTLAALVPVPVSPKASCCQPSRSLRASLWALRPASDMRER